MQLLISADVMVYFDLSKKTELITDALPSGLSAILVQSTAKQYRQVTAYNSRALSAVERQYSQTEQEALEIIWVNRCLSY